MQDAIADGWSSGASIVDASDLAPRVAFDLGVLRLHDWRVAAEWTWQRGHGAILHGTPDHRGMKVRPGIHRFRRIRNFRTP